MTCEDDDGRPRRERSVQLLQVSIQGRHDFVHIGGCRWRGVGVGNELSAGLRGDPCESDQRFSKSDRCEKDIQPRALARAVNRVKAN